MMMFSLATVACMALGSNGFRTNTATFEAPAVFSIVRKQDQWWLRDPDGKPFWSFGVCCTDLGQKPEDVQPGNAGYRALNLHASKEAWASDTAARLRSWGFNSLGGWSDAELFTGRNRMPYFPVLHLGAYDLAPWHDLFAPAMAKAIDGAAKDQILKVRDDPMLVGYFTDNELGWWTDTIFIKYLAMPSDSPGRKVLLSTLKRHYRGNFARLQSDWITPAKSFADLDQKADLRLRPGGSGIQAVDAWTTVAASHYYAMVRRAVRKYDSRHLILGDRYCQYYDLPVARAAAPYVDAISTNIGAEWIDGGTSRFFLETLHKVTKRPVLITEFYMAAMENQTGNRNSSGGFPVVQTQAQRAAAFGRNVSELAARPYVLGAHWFQFYDEPPKGRGDGEDYNMGLVDVSGKPYPLLTATVAGLEVTKRHGRSATSSYPNTASKASATPMKGLLTWDRKRSLIEPTQGTPFADLYASWTPHDLYVGLLAMDYIDEHLYEGDRIPDSERPTWRVKIAGMEKPVTVRYGGKDQAARGDVSGVEVAELPGLKYTVILRIPRSLLGKTDLRPGASLRIESDLASHSRAERMGWRRDIRLLP